MHLAILNLPIKKKWFDMILSGQKQEEYRAHNAQCFKVENEIYDITSDYHLPPGCVVILRNGYGPDSPSAAVEVKSILFHTPHALSPWRHPEWGEPNPADKSYHSIRLGKIIAKGGYGFIRAITISRRSERGKRIWLDMLKRCGNGILQKSNIGVI